MTPEVPPSQSHTPLFMDTTTNQDPTLLSSIPHIKSQIDPFNNFPTFEIKPIIETHHIILSRPPNPTIEQ